MSSFTTRIISTRSMEVLSNMNTILTKCGVYRKREKRKAKSKKEVLVP